MVTSRSTNANHTLQLLSVTTTDLHAAIDALRRNVINAEESVGRCVRTRHATELGNIERYLALRAAAMRLASGQRDRAAERARQHDQSPDSPTTPTGT